jgi:hypothetical protein
MELGPGRSNFGHYSPKCVEGEFYELRIDGVLRSTHGLGPTLVSVYRAQVYGSIRLHLLGEGERSRVCRTRILAPAAF